MGSGIHPCFSLSSNLLLNIFPARRMLSQDSVAKNLHLWIHMKEILCKATIVSTFVLTAVVSGAAFATPFLITGANFANIGGGYGFETNGTETGGNATKLDVSFAPSFSAHNFTLTNAGDASGLFKFGTVKFSEQSISLGESINPDLAVSVIFSFSAPGVGQKPSGPMV
jgi:hypothetical protein